MTACNFCGQLEGHKATCDRPAVKVKTMNSLADEKPAPEVDDFRAALFIVSEQAATTPEARMWYAAVWVARLREYYVEVGRNL